MNGKSEKARRIDKVKNKPKQLAPISIEAEKLVENTSIFYCLWQTKLKIDKFQDTTIDMDR